MIVLAIPPDILKEPRDSNNLGISKLSNADLTSKNISTILSFLVRLIAKLEYKPTKRHFIQMI